MSGHPSEEAKMEIEAKDETKTPENDNKPKEQKESKEQKETKEYSIKKGDENYEESIKIAENYKEQGNNFLKENKFNDAIEQYTRAIELNIETEKNAIYFSNRAFVNFKLENYGYTINDANEAIKCNPAYLKAYYRRGKAYNILGKFDEAIKDFKFLIEKGLKDDDLEINYQRAVTARKKKKFFEAFSSEGRGKPNMDQIIKTLTPPSKDYKGPIFPENKIIDDNFVINLMDYMTDLKLEKTNEQRYIDERSLILMVKTVKDYFYNIKEALIDIEIPEDIKFNVIGDIHGQYYDLRKIFELQGYPSEKNWFLFNGDFVDRGVFGVECITTLLAWKIRYPKYFYLSRGNHEDSKMNSLYGFKTELNKKYNNKERVYDCMVELFYSLPLGHILNKDILVVHGGLFSQDNVKIADLKKIDRFKEIPEKGLFSELLWADPCKEKGRMPSKRGLGMAFGPDIAENFLNDNGLSLLIRSHEVKMEGYEIEPGEKVITLFSAPNYCDTMGNKGAIIELVNKNGKLEKKFITFTSAEHPKVPVGSYMNFSYFR